MLVAVAPAGQGCYREYLFLVEGEHKVHTKVITIRRAGGCIGQLGKR